VSVSPAWFRTKGAVEEVEREKRDIQREQCDEEVYAKYHPIMEKHVKEEEGAAKGEAAMVEDTVLLVRGEPKYFVDVTEQDQANMTDEEYVSFFNACTRVYVFL
jgi:hypothetical protein